MHDILVVLVHSIVTVVRLIKPGGLRAVVEESALTQQQPLSLHLRRKPAPSLRVSDHIMSVYAPISYAALRYCPKAIHAAAFPSRTHQTRVSGGGLVR